MLYNRSTGIYKFGNNTYPRRIRRRSNLGHIFGKKIASYGPGNRYIFILLIYVHIYICVCVCVMHLLVWILNWVHDARYIYQNN